MRFALAVNCTGPLGTIATRDRLLRSCSRRAVRPDELGMGLDVDGNRGWRERSAWAMGPLTKGKFWEIIAVPDIRDQVAAVADGHRRGT